MKAYVAPSLELLSDIEDLAYIDLLIGNADPLDVVPCFSSYIDCI